ELPHRPELAAVPGRMNASRVRKLARVVDVMGVIDAVEILRRIQPIDWAPGDCREGGRALRRLLQRRLERFVLPALFAAFGNRFHTNGSIPSAIVVIGCFTARGGSPSSQRGR